MRLKRVVAIVLRQMYLLRGSPVRIFPIVAWVAIDMVLWGFLTRYLNTVAANGVNFVATVLGAVLFWDYCCRVMQGVSAVFLEEVWSRNFLNLFSSPLSISEHISGMVLTSVLTSLVGLLTMLLTAMGIFHLELFSLGVSLAAFLFVLFLFGITLGILGCAIVMRFGQAAEWVVHPLPALLAPFVGVSYPVETLPAWMQMAARALPPSYVFEGMRELVSGRSAPTHLLLVGGLLAVLELLGAACLYASVYRRAVRTGFLARYSAEGTA